MNQNDKSKCLLTGRQWEDRVQRAFLRGLRLPFARNDDVVSQNMDFKCTFEIDVKYRGVKFRTAKTYVGLDSDKALALNVNKLERYAKNPIGKFILIIVDFSPNEGTNGIYLISV